ncbi:GvpL/GvpF family gas vesicle protein [Streptomyces zhihengii]|uniref:GvpL/GvpF family gas vesicle protein n=1 Tax=Streptomyces zhihengii TaxID=1818004 RepID=A0ABS2V1H0_9ACTN|nr:GvpL/GvpF family gas vesicle protein [Streptomyces zhihengii]MBM9623297.1 GvpL/GvpF family gas vesicle protein [Streptomyces zhihengii]
MSDSVVYAYAVVRAADGVGAAAGALAGVAGGPVRLTAGSRDPGVLLAVGEVPAADFREEALRRRLEELEWLETVARAHHAVVEALAAVTTVLPLRLATVYVDEAGARAALDEGARAFAERLSLLAGHREWGVKVYADPSAAPPPPAPAADGLSPGRSYLRQRREQRSGREEVYRDARTAAGRVEEAALRYAAGRARHRVQQGTLAGAAGENVLNDAFLVADDRTEAFRTDVAGAAQGLTGVRVEVTGPWAPYSFAVPAEGNGDAEDAQDTEDTEGTQGRQGDAEGAHDTQGAGGAGSARGPEGVRGAADARGPEGGSAP